MRQSKRMRKQLTKLINRNLNDEASIRAETAKLDGEDTVKSYLMKFFIGKAGWKYVSISKPGSLFKTPLGNMIVMVKLHKTMPVLIETGRYEADKDMMLTPIKLNDIWEMFEGMVVDNTGKVYVGDDSYETVEGASTMHPTPVAMAFLTSKPELVFSEVEADEFSLASDEYVAKLKSAMQKTNAQFSQLSKFFDGNQAADPELEKTMGSLEKKLDEIPESQDGLKVLKNMAESLSDAVEQSADMMKELKEATDALTEIETTDDLTESEPEQ